jgi:predicted nucleotidyltransferase
MNKTIRDLSLEEKRKYIEARKKFEEEEKKLLDIRYEKALNLAKEISEILYKKYKAKKVILVGSLKDKELFTKWSDIDLAVAGISNKDYFKALSEVLSLSVDFKIDIIDLDSCEEEIRNRLEGEGILL